MLKKKIRSLSAAIASGTALLLLNAQNVLADAGITVHSADEVATKATNTINPIIKDLGAVCVLAGVAMIGIKLMFAHNNPDKRSNAMTGIFWLGIGAFMTGGAMLFAGFFWGLGK